MRKSLIQILIIAIVVGGIFYLHGKKEEKAAAIRFNCTEEKANNFDCYRSYYSNMVKNNSVADAFEDLKSRYEKSDYVSSQCHQIVHVIGFEASKKWRTVTQAYKEGDSFCWSGYYHGVLEGISNQNGYKNFVKNINEICKPLAETRRYSFDHYNCVHGLGHGIMALKDDELFQSLDICDGLNDSWERTSCWSGAFMENVMMDSRYHTAKYLKPEDPLYPCNAVGKQYKETCYLMQTSYILTVVNSNFSKVFELCSGIEPEYRNICYQSLGRDASGRSTSNVKQTVETCYLGKNYDQRANCIIGAVKDFISYLHSDTRAKELCAALDDKNLQDVCMSTAESYYNNL